MPCLALAGGTPTLCILFALLLAALLIGLAAMHVMYRHLHDLASRARASTAELQLILDALPAFVFYKDAQNHLLRVNRRVAEACGRGKSELEGYSCAEIFPDEAAAYWEDDIEVIESGRGKHNITEQLETPSGKLWVRTDKIPLRTADNETVGVIGFSIDITAEHDATRQLEEQAGRNDALISALGEIVYERDIATDTIEWHGALEDTLGLPSSAPLAALPDWLERVHPGDRTRVAARLAEVQQDLTRFNIEYRVRHQAGHYVWINDRGVARENALSGHKAIVGLIEDIGYRKHYEETITQYTARLEQSNRDLKQFAYVASHDLQDPLRKIIAFGDLLKPRVSDGSLDDQARMCIARMQSAALRMRKLVNALLQYSRVSTRITRAHDVDINTALGNVEATLELQIAESGAVIVADDVESLNADPMQIEQLLQNLISNAIKYRDPSRLCVVRVRTSRRNDGTVELTVSDNGIGLDPQHAERILAPFQRLHSQSEFEGTGMGLAICRRIVEAHGGTISATGKPGEGATFTITFPDEVSHDD